MNKNFRIKYLRRGEWTMATNKKGEIVSFETVTEARAFVSHARNTEPNNPITFMDRVDICEYDGDNLVEIVEHF